MKGWKQAAIAVGAATALLSLSFAVGVGIAAMIGVSFAPQSSQDLAAWAQAVGSVAAIAVAWHLGVGQARYARRMMAVADEGARTAAESAVDVLNSAVLNTLMFVIYARKKGLGMPSPFAPGLVLRGDLVDTRDILRSIVRSLERVALYEHLLPTDRSKVDSAIDAAGRILNVVDTSDFRDRARDLLRVTNAHKAIRAAYYHFKPDGELPTL